MLTPKTTYNSMAKYFAITTVAMSTGIPLRGTAGRTRVFLTTPGIRTIPISGTY